MTLHVKLRVGRREAMEMLGVRSGRVFRKIVDACPDLCHRLPGETRCRYRTDVLHQLLRCGVPGEGRAQS